MPDLAAALHGRLAADAGVSAIVGTKIYPVAVGQKAEAPYIRYLIVSDPRPQHMKGYDGARQTLVQIDCYAAEYGVSRTLAQACVDALAGPAEHGGIRFGRGKAEGPRDFGEDTEKGFVYRAVLEVNIEWRPA